MKRENNLFLVLIKLIRHIIEEENESNPQLEKEKLSDKEVLFVLESLFKHKEQLYKYELYHYFIKNLKEELRSEVLKEIAAKRLT